jgi:hypothetical protein
LCAEIDRRRGRLFLLPQDCRLENDSHAVLGYIDEMAVPVPSVFIAYRYVGLDAARAVGRSLESRGFGVHLDVEPLKPGRLDKSVLERIEKSTAFILICSPNCLDACSHSQDWIRREVAHALRSKRTIASVILPGFTWPQLPLPSDIEDLRHQPQVEYAIGSALTLRWLASWLGRGAGHQGVPLVGFERTRDNSRATAASEDAVVTKHGLEPPPTPPQANSSASSTRATTRFDVDDGDVRKLERERERIRMEEERLARERRRFDEHARALHQEIERRNVERRAVQAKFDDLRREMQSVEAELDGMRSATRSGADQLRLGFESLANRARVVVEQEVPDPVLLEELKRGMASLTSIHDRLVATSTLLREAVNRKVAHTALLASLDQRLAELEPTAFDATANEFDASLIEGRERRAERRPRSKSHRVFLSYSSSDLDEVERIARRLEAFGIACWYSERDLAPATKEYADGIMTALVESAMVIVLVSDKAMASPHVRNEVHAATDGKKSILPVYASGFTGPLNRTFDYYIRVFQRLELPRDDDKLVATVARLLKDLAPPSSDKR